MHSSAPGKKLAVDLDVSSCDILALNWLYGKPAAFDLIVTSLLNPERIIKNILLK